MRLNEEQYRSLCVACDRVLTSGGASSVRVAIPWLHVVREHPVFLQQYAGLFEHRKPSHTLRSVIGGLRAMAGRVGNLVTAALHPSPPWHGTEPFLRQVDVLFVSHILNEQQAGAENDFYFGSLPAQLAASGWHVTVALINHSDLPAEHLATKWKNGVPRVVLSGWLNWSCERTIQRQLCREARSLAAKSGRERDPFYAAVLREAGRQAGKGGARAALRIGMQIQALAQACNPGILVTTFEGHSWERLVFHNVHHAVAGTSCIGYQHAALFRRQHALRRNLGNGFDPDHVLTAGTVTFKQLQPWSANSAIPVSVLGSPRISAAINSGQPRPRSESAKNGPCLVVPEGIVEECVHLFDLSLTCARRHPDIRFVWRLHPLIRFDELAAGRGDWQQLPANVELSSATLDQDIERCATLLYRGSTVVLTAAMAGLRPIYYSMGESLDIDPLYELSGWKTVVASPVELAARLKETEKSALLSAERDMTAVYCRHYYTVPDIQVLESLIRGVEVPAHVTPLANFYPHSGPPA